MAWAVWLTLSVKGLAGSCSDPAPCSGPDTLKPRVAGFENHLEVGSEQTHSYPGKGLPSFRSLPKCHLLQEAFHNSLPFKIAFLITRCSHTLL